MSSLFALRALTFAGECFVASVLLMTSAAIATRFLKHAAVRHFVWLTAFGATLVLPAAALILPPQIVMRHPVYADLATDEIVAPPAFPGHIPAPPVGRPPLWNMDARDVALGVAALWSLGVGWAVLRLLIGAIGINALQMSSAAFRREGLEQLAFDVGDCELRLASEDSGPMTWGFAKPVILLPKESIGWPAERLRAVLLHEMAHIRRRDSLAQMVSLIACAIYWPNPLTWLAARALRRDAEIAADDAVIRAGMKPSAYASALLEIAAAVRGGATMLAGVAMASHSSLEWRLEALLTANPSRRGVTSMDVLKIAGIGLLATTAMAFSRPTFAEDTSPPARVVQVTPAAAAPAEATAPVEAVEPAEVSPPVQAALPVEDEFNIPDVRVRISHHRTLTAHERARIRAAVHRARKALAQARPQIEAAMARAEPEMKRAMAEVRRVQPEIERAMQRVRETQPEIERAMQHARDAQPQIAMTIEEARIQLAKTKFDNRIQRRVAEALARAERKLREQHVDMHDRELETQSEAAESDDNRDTH
jgi:beta-lactamase regulating signal transducer with metallopeptidase domain